MPTEERAMGAIPSPMDYRDYQVKSFYPTVSSHPSEYQPKELIPAEFQGGVGACVAFGLELQTAYHELAERGTLERFDQNYIYANRLPEHHQGEGMHPRQAYAMLIRYGVPPKGKGFAFGTPRPYFTLKDTEITPKMNSHAVFQRIKSYFTLQTVEEIKTALQHGPVGITIPVYKSFERCPVDGMLRLPDTSQETILGYHYIVIIGWTRDNRWVIQNSWRGWGDRQMLDYSMAYMPYNYPISERWGVIDEELPPINTAKTKERKIELWIGKRIAKIDGKEVTVDADEEITPILVKGKEITRTMLPTRFTADSLGARRVDWDQSEQKVTILCDVVVR